MFNNTIINNEVLSEDIMMDSEVFVDVYSQIVKTLSEKQFTISQTRYLFNNPDRTVLLAVIWLRK